MNKITTSKSILASGLTVLSAKPNRHVDSAYIELTVQVGARNDADTFFGLAHFVEHILSAIISDKLRLHGWMNNYLLDTFDASTDHEKTTYYIACAKDDVGDSLAFLLSLLSGPRIAEQVTNELIEQELAVVAEELLGYNDEEGTSAKQQLASNYFGDNTLSRETVLGKIETLQHFTKTKVQEFIEQYYRPDNSFLVIAGNINTVDLGQQVDNVLSVVSSQIPSPAFKNASRPPVLTDNTVLYHLQEAEQNTLVVMRPLQIRNSAQAVELIVLCGMLQQYLEYNGRQQGLAYGVLTTYRAYRDHFDFIIESSFASEKTVALYNWLTQAIEQFSHELTDSVVEQYKQNLLNTTRLELAYPITALNTLSWYYYYFGDLVSVETEMSYIEAVTTSHLAQLYEKVVRTSQGAILISGIITDEIKKATAS